MEALPRGTVKLLVGLVALAFACLCFATSRADAIIIWADGGTSNQPDTLASAHRDGTGVDEFFVPNTSTEGIFHTRGVAVGASHVYWATSEGTIGRANLDGSNPDRNFIVTNGGNPLAVAVDSGHIYWTNAGGGTIGKARKDGTHVNQFYIFTRYNPSTGGTVSGLAVDGKYIYWSNDRTVGTSSTGSIGRATVVAPNTTVNQNFIPNVRSPGGLAVNGSQIFWSNSNFDGSDSAIGRANIDGSSINQSFIPLGGNAVANGITLGSSHIYWSSPPVFGTSSIGRANLDGTEAQKSFIRRTAPSWGVAITPKPSGAHRH
jgi:hypothetical protein